MKTYRILSIAIVTGKPDELDRVDKLAAGTHHLRRYPRLTLAKMAHRTNKVIRKLLDKQEL